MSTYHLSIHKEAYSFCSMDTFSTHEIQLKDKEEFEQVKQLCEDRKNMAGPLKQTFVPIRTDRASDLLLPTLMNTVIKTKDLAQNCFMVITAIVWDIATLPIRLLTFIPRMVYNIMTKPEEHPLIPYLKGKGLAAVDIEGEAPLEGFEDSNGKRTHRYLEKDGRANVLLYTKEIKDGRIDERSGVCYQLYLTDREIAFPILKSDQFGSGHSLDGKPVY